MEILEKYESDVRSYCRSFPATFKKAKNAYMYDIEGNKYIDFFCGAGALNYGHNNDYIKEKLINYIENDGITHSLDLYTEPKVEFVKYFQEELLQKRDLNYKIQFTNASGTNAVEAALKLARKYTQRSNVFAIMGAFHGMTLGSLALTTDVDSRKGAGVPLTNVTHIPAPYMFKGLDVLEYIERIITDDHSGIDKPACIVLESTQAEGGIYVFDNEFLKGIRDICDKHDILMVMDEIQVGCCRTGDFFSFERAEIKPDIIAMSKSIGGYGLPMAITLFKKEFDIWTPGEHNGTFRGNQLAFVAGKAALEFLLENKLEEEVKRKGAVVKKYLEENMEGSFEIRGIGLMWGIDVFEESLSKKIVQECFKENLILERAGRNNSVVKIMPPLTIPDEVLEEGLQKVVAICNRVLQEEKNLEQKTFTKKIHTI